MVERNQSRIEAGRWVELEQLLRGPLDPVRLDHVAGKLLRAIEWVINWCRNLREISVAHLHRRHCEKRPACPAFAEALKVRHEEQTIGPFVDLWQPNRTAQCET